MPCNAAHMSPHELMFTLINSMNFVQLVATNAYVNFVYITIHIAVP